MMDIYVAKFPTVFISRIAPVTALAYVGFYSLLSIVKLFGPLLDIRDGESVANIPYGGIASGEGFRNVRIEGVS